MEDFFYFKEFSVKQNSNQLKVNTDSVILGTWVDVSFAKKVLDVGTGTGVVSLLIAQRNINTEIYGLEIDADSTLEAKYNFQNSKWANRLYIINEDINEYIPTERFDLIISNPPYFTNDFKSENKVVNRVKHVDNLSLSQLIDFADKNLIDEGELVIIYPFREFKKDEELIVNSSFEIKKIVYVYPKINKKPHRVLLSFSRNVTKTQVEYIVIRNETNGYHHSYLDLVEEYYRNRLVK